MNTLTPHAKTLFRCSRLLPLILAALILLTPRPARAADDTATVTPLSAEWRQALQPLAAMPVQDFGYIRSAYTFGENHLSAIADRSSYHGMNPLETVLLLMAKPEAVHTWPLIKVVRPQLVKVFGDKMISLDLYRKPEIQARLQELVDADQKLGEAWGDVNARADHLEALEKDFAIFPRPTEGDKAEWLAPAQLTGATAHPGDAEIARQWTALKAALRANDPKAGATAASALADAVNKSANQQSVKLPKLGLDYFYHSHLPFRKSYVYYLFAALAFGASLLFGRKQLGWAGYGLMTLGLVEQAIGVTARWILAGRAPLSNMYESFTFAVGGMVLVALVFEIIYRNRLAGLGGAVLGFIFMVLADKAPIFDSQIRPLMPALQSSWLTYHVVVIMLSYSAFALSFFISIAYLGKDFLGGNNSPIALLRRVPTLEALDLFNYKIVAIGFPLLTLGIIFGAVWASTAWGRPWGFDPKETWSAITWLIYAIYLHARYLAGWKGRPAAFLALLGFLGVLFTYLGVNFLLPGLHSYA